MGLWWDNCLNKSKSELIQLRSYVHMTVFGAFQPPTVKTKLLNVVSMLNSNGYADCDIVGGKLRPYQGYKNVFELSHFYLKYSDVNLLVLFYKAGLQGVTTEVSCLLDSPDLNEKWSTSAIFHEKKKTGEAALGNVLGDKLVHLGNPLTIVEFANLKELYDSLLVISNQFLRRLENLIRSRIKIP